MKKQILIQRFDPPLWQDTQHNDCRSHLRARHKAGRRHNHSNLRIAVILHCNGKRTVIFCAGQCLHPSGNLLLHHNGQAGDRVMLFQKLHQYRRCDVIRQVRNNLDWSAVIFFANQGIEVCFQNILIQNFNVVISSQRLPQYGNQCGINLNRQHPADVFRQHLCQRTDTRADFQHKVLRRNFRAGNDIV